MPFSCCSLLFCLQLFSFLFFSYIGWSCGAGVFGLIGCQSPSPGLALPIFFNNNNKTKVMPRWKVTVEIQDGRRKDAEGIRNVDSCLESAYYFMTHFS